LGGLNWIIRRWLGDPQPWSYVIIDLAGVVLMSVIIGVYVAASYRRQASELALPRWEDYPTS